GAERVARPAVQRGEGRLAEGRGGGECRAGARRDAQSNAQAVRRRADRSAAGEIAPASRATIREVEGRRRCLADASRDGLRVSATAASASRVRSSAGAQDAAAEPRIEQLHASNLSYGLPAPGPSRVTRGCLARETPAASRAAAGERTNRSAAT